MDLRLVLLLAVGSVVAVDAWSRPRPTGRLCETLCGRGTETPYCRCRNLSPCDLKRCSARAVCAVRYGRGVCIPRRSYGPTPAECRYPKVVGRCRAAIPRYFYNTTTRRCESFTFGGCGANPNNFRTLRECQTKCQRGARRSRTRD